jgi:hypothetical protein
VWFTKRRKPSDVDALDAVHPVGFPIVLAKFWGLRSVEGHGPG